MYLRGELNEQNIRRGEMIIKSIIGATCACLTVVSFSASAAIVNIDWKTEGDSTEAVCIYY